MTLFDHHTHNPNAPAGRAVICLPHEILENPTDFKPREGAMYSAGIHPWWTDAEKQTEKNKKLEKLWHGVEQLAAHPQVVALGETGFDRLRGDIDLQKELFEQHVRLAENTKKRLIIHCVRAFDILLQARAQFRPNSPWLVHGFSGKPTLAGQLLAAGIQLSFGHRANPATLAFISTNELRFETDDSSLSIEEISNSLLEKRKFAQNTENR